MGINEIIHRKLLTPDLVYMVATTVVMVMFEALVGIIVAVVAMVEVVSG